MQDCINTLHSLCLPGKPAGCLPLSYLDKQIANITNICDNIPKESFYKRAKLFDLNNSQYALYVSVDRNLCCFSL